MAMKTVRQIESAKPEKKAYKLTVDRGLYLNVSTTGTKSWQVRYVIEGKQRQLSLPAHYGNGDGFKSSHAQRVDVSVPGGQWQLAISSESIEEDKNSRLCGYFFYEIFSTETQVG